ncbi:MAG: hypothetical protein AVDCRST_MAG10-1498, partial [uncultured Acidimicrobiales bacterium]
EDPRVPRQRYPRTGRAHLLPGDGPVGLGQRLHGRAHPRLHGGGRRLHPGARARPCHRPAFLRRPAGGHPHRIRWVHDGAGPAQRSVAGRHPGRPGRRLPGGHRGRRPVASGDVGVPHRRLRPRHPHLGEHLLGGLQPPADPAARRWPRRRRHLRSAPGAVSVPGRRHRPGARRPAPERTVHGHRRLHVRKPEPHRPPGRPGPTAAGAARPGPPGPPPGPHHRSHRGDRGRRRRVGVVRGGGDVGRADGLGPVGRGPARGGPSGPRPASGRHLPDQPARPAHGGPGRGQAERADRPGLRRLRRRGGRHDRVSDGQRRRPPRPGPGGAADPAGPSRASPHQRLPGPPARPAPRRALPRRGEGGRHPFPGGARPTGGLQRGLQLRPGRGHRVRACVARPGGRERLPGHQPPRPGQQLRHHPGHRRLPGPAVVDGIGPPDRWVRGGGHRHI